MLQIRNDISKVTVQVNTNLEDEIKQLENNIEDQETLLTKHKYANKMNKLYTDLMKEYVELEQLTLKQYVSHQLVSIIEHTEYYLLTDTVSLFNQCLEEIVASLFDEPITVKLELFKTNATNTRTKSNIHLHISYKGMDLHNTKELSGGENARISLALLIAFHIVHPTPFVMIDESLSSINHQLRELSIIAIKRFIKSPIFIILHETSSEGSFDHIVNV